MKVLLIYSKRGRLSFVSYEGDELLEMGNFVAVVG